MSELKVSEEFRINRLEQFIMAMGYPLPPMGCSSDVNWVHPVREIKSLTEENKRLRDAIHKACSESCNVAVCGTIMMSADLFNGLVDAHNGCEEKKGRED